MLYQFSEFFGKVRFEILNPEDENCYRAKIYTTYPKWMFWMNDTVERAFAERAGSEWYGHFSGKLSNKYEKNLNGKLMFLRLERKGLGLNGEMEK